MQTIMGHRYETGPLSWDRVPALGRMGQSAAEALQAAGADFDIEKRPVTLANLTPATVVPGRYDILRPPTAFDSQPATLGRVGSAYQLFANRDLANAIDESGLPARWPVHAVLVVNSGQQVCIVLDAGACEVANDCLSRYVLLVTGHDGTTATLLSYRPAWERGTAALFLGTQEGTLTLRKCTERTIPHGLLDSLQVVRLFELAQSHLHHILAQLARYAMTTRDFQGVLGATFPEPPRLRRREAYESTLTWTAVRDAHTEARYRVREMRQTAAHIYCRVNDEEPSANAGSAYNLYRALVELLTHYDGPQWQDVTPKEHSLLFGTRAAAMGRAWGALKPLVDCHGT